MYLINDNLYEYVMNEILYNYTLTDGAHDITHIINVISRSIELGEKLNLNEEYLFVASSFHDIGRRSGVKMHEKESSRIFLSDDFLRNYFNEEEQIIISNAIEDHRGTNKTAPRSIYGKILHDVDKFGDDIETLIRRSIRYGMHQFADYTKQQHLKRTYEYLKKKYGDAGYVNLYLNYPLHKYNLKEIRKIINNINAFESVFDLIYFECRLKKEN